MSRWVFFLYMYYRKDIQCYPKKIIVLRVFVICFNNYTNWFLLYYSNFKKIIDKLMLHCIIWINKITDQ